MVLLWISILETWTIFFKIIGKLITVITFVIIIRKCPHCLSLTHDMMGNQFQNLLRSISLIPQHLLVNYLIIAIYGKFRKSPNISDVISFPSIKWHILYCGNLKIMLFSMEVFNSVHVRCACKWFMNSLYNEDENLEMPKTQLHSI